MIKQLPILLLLLAVFTGSVASQEYSDWKWKHPQPQGNALRWVKTWDANNWYAIGYAGTFMKTSNAGASWYFHHKAGWPQTDASTGSLYSAHFFSQTTGLVAGEDGVLRTTNGGVSFDTTALLSASGTIYSMFFINNTTGFVTGTSSIKVYKTTDAGLTWSQVPGLGTITVYDIYATDLNNIIISSSSGNVYKTTNGGTNWTTVLTGTSATLYAMHFKNPNTGYVAGSSGTFRYTTNGGLNWTTANTPSTSIMYNLFMPDTNTVYAIGDALNLYKTTNNGTNWTAIQVYGGVQPWTSTYYDMDMSGTTAVVVGGNGLIQKSTNSGNNFVTLSHFIHPTTMYDVYAESNNGKVWVIGNASLHGEHIIYTSNGGTTWSVKNTNSLTTITYENIQMLNSLTGYICGESGRLKKTTDGGTTWDSLASGTANWLNSLDFVNLTTGYAAGNSGTVIKTTNGGTTWSTLTSGITTTIESIDFANAMTGWLAGSSGALRKTTDGGTTWAALTSGVTATIYDLKFLDSLTGFYAGSSGNVRKTTDGGTTWTQLVTPATTTLYTMDAVSANDIIAAGSGGVVFRTTNGGTTWLFENTGGSTIYSVDMRHRDSAFVVGSLAYVHRMANTMTGITEWNNEVPDNFELSQNYPNPFNPSTTIKFSIPYTSKITFKIFDITGKEIVSLFNNIEMNKGIVTYTFDGTSFASGTYFYSLIVDGVVFDTKKMVLVK